MKTLEPRIILPLVGMACLIAACDGRKGTEVKATVNGGAGKTLYFDRFENNKAIHVDSVVLDANGKGTLRVPNMHMDFYRIGFDDTDALVVAMDSTDKLEFTASVGAMNEPEKIAGAPQSESLHAFYSDTRRFEKRLDSLRTKMNQDGPDSTTMAAFNTTNQEYYDHCTTFIKDNPGSPACLSAVSKLDMQREFDLFKAVRDELRVPMARSDFYTAFRDQVDRATKQMEATKKQEEEMKRLSNLIPIGSPAPDFTQQTPDGKSLALSDLRGKVVLIDFWASWCKPCRIENPNVKRVYDKYHNKGFEILGVSLDRTKDAWVAAIQQDGLPWKHVSDLAFWNNAAAQEYGVSSIPFTVLVDRDGNIVDKGLRGQALERKLAEIFGS